VNLGVDDAVVRGRENVGEVERLLVGHIVRDREEVGLAKGDLDVLGLTSGETAGEMRVAKEAGVPLESVMKRQVPTVNIREAFRGKAKDVRRERTCPYIVFMREELLVRSQKEESFFWQYWHVPQAIWKEATTRWPTLRLVTSGPTRSTTPILHNPIVTPPPKKKRQQSRNRGVSTLL
jgi:hypothetical protein